MSGALRDRRTSIRSFDGRAPSVAARSSPSEEFIVGSRSPCRAAGHGVIPWPHGRGPWQLRMQDRCRGLDWSQVWERARSGWCLGAFAGPEAVFIGVLVAVDLLFAGVFSPNRLLVSRVVPVPFFRFLVATTLAFGPRFRDDLQRLRVTAVLATFPNWVGRGTPARGCCCLRRPPHECAPARSPPSRSSSPLGIENIGSVVLLLGGFSHSPCGALTGDIR